jgi:hypothetical protein
MLLSSPMLLTFLLSDSGGPAAVDISAVPILFQLLLSSLVLTMSLMWLAGFNYLLVCRWFRFAQLAKGKKFRP